MHLNTHTFLPCSVWMITSFWRDIQSLNLMRRGGRGDACFCLFFLCEASSRQEHCESIYPLISFLFFRWDIQRIREQRMFQRLQQRMNRRKVIQESEPELLSFYPDLEDGMSADGFWPWKYLVLSFNVLIFCVFPQWSLLWWHPFCQWWLLEDLFPTWNSSKLQIVFVLHNPNDVYFDILI